jgi:thiol:disulfide interchange protein
MLPTDPVSGGVPAAGIHASCALHASGRRALLCLVLLTASGLTIAKPWWTRGSTSNEQDFLPPDDAFRLSAHTDGNLVRLRWVIADGYYLYRSRIEVRAESPDLLVDPPVLPAGTPINDAYLGSQQVYRQQVEASVGFKRLDYGAHPLQLKVFYQGCAEAGLCYPLLSKVISPDALAPPRPGSPAWEPVAIIGGGCAFLLAGLMLRRGRRLEMPAA